MRLDSGNVFKGIPILLAIVLLPLSTGRALAVQALTATEQSARIDEVTSLFQNSRPPEADATRLVEQTILRAQQSEPYFRRPVSWDEIEELASRLEKATGRAWSLPKTAETVDYVQTLMREQGVIQTGSLAARIDRSLEVDRKAFHGQVAEFREARARGMLLTKDKQSTTFDLTEDRFRPRSAQLKVFKNGGLGALQDDLQSLPKRARYGILPQDDVDMLVERGELRLRGIAGNEPVYRPRSGPQITVLAAREVKSASDSAAYAERGKAGAGELREADALAEGAGASSPTLGHIAAQGLGVLGLAGSGLLGWDAYEQSRIAWAMWNDPILRKTALPYLQTGIAGGRLAEAGTLGLYSADYFGLLGRGDLSLFGRAAGEWVLPMMVVVESYNAGVVYYEYSTGRISKREFYRRTTGPAIFVVCTTGGAIIGGFSGGAADAGATVLTDGPAAAAMPEAVSGGAGLGASVGAFVSIPVAHVADWAWNRWYKKFDEKKRAAVDAAVERYYGLPTQ